MRTSFSLLLCLLLAAGPSCAVRLSGLDGQAVAERDGRLYLDDVLLEHHREVSLSGMLGPGRHLDVASHTGAVDLVGVATADYELVVDVYSEFEDDGEVALVGDRIEVVGETLGRVLVNGVRGRLPAGTSLDVRTGTGEIILTGLQGVDLEVGSGTGAVHVLSSGGGRLSVKTGTGDVTVTEGRWDETRLRSGTGHMFLSRSDLERIDGSSGTGDFRLEGCRSLRASFRSGTGDVVLRETSLGELSESLGTGQVVGRPIARH